MPNPVSAPHETPGQPEGSGYASLDYLADTARYYGDGMQYFTVNHARALQSALGELARLRSLVHRLEGEREEAHKPATSEWLRELHGMSDAELFGWLDLARARMEPADAAAVDQIRFRFCAAITNDASRLTPQDTTTETTQ